MRSRISVIIPFYKVENYLAKCIESVIHQTYENLEIILVDDGSPDRCGEIADEYAKKDERIKVIHKENGGLSDGRNVGLESANGDYVTFVDSDDYIHPQMCEALLLAVEDGKKDVAVCGYQYVYEGQEAEVISYKMPVSCLEVNGREIQKVYLKQSPERLNYTTAWGKLYKKKCFDHVRYPKGKLHEDEYTTFQLLYEANAIGYVDVPLYFYLSRESSIMGEFKVKRFDVFGGYEKRIRYYMEHGEKELAKSTYYLGLHMLAQYRSWMNSQNKECQQALKGTVASWKKIKKQFHKDWLLNKRECVEKLLFQMSFSIYYVVWKMLK